MPRCTGAFSTADAVRLAVGNRFYAPRCSAAFLVFAGGAELRSGLCTRAVVCVICAAPLRLLYAAQETERFLGCLRVGRMCADIWSGFAFPVPLLPSKKCELEGAITARCFIYPNGTALLLRTVGRTRLPRGSCGCKSRRRGSVKYTCGTPKAACFTQKSGLGTVPGLFLSALPTRLA